MKKIKIGLMATCFATMMGTTCFASSNVHFMNQGSNNDRGIRPTIATNIEYEEPTTSIDISRGSSNRKVVAAPATDVKADEPTHKIDLTRGSSNRKVIAAPATDIAE